MPARCITDATIHPMTSPDAIAEAICWDDNGCIVAIGDRSDVEAAAAAHNIPVESLPGRTVIPGFVDAHMHFLHVGVRRIRPDLRPTKSLNDALDRVATWINENPGDDAVIAEGWDESEWPEGRFPTRDEVDGLSKERPVILRRQCGHFAVANSVALKALRSHWDDPELVDLESGILLEQPSLYLNEVYGVSPGDLDDALQVATDIAHRLGVTCVGEYTQTPFREALLRSANDGTLRIRLANHIYVQQLNDEIDAGFRTGTPRGLHYNGQGRTSPSDANDHEAPRDPSNPAPAIERMRDGGLKVFHDGSFGGRTALLREPYLDDPDSPTNRGTQVWTDEEVDRWYQTAHGAGIQVTAHAIGDAAIDQGLDGYERLQQKADAGELPPWAEAPATQTPGNPNARDAASNPQVNGLRHRFEHYELPHDDAIERTVKLGIVACSQPNFLGEWSAKGGMYEQRLGSVFRLNNRYRTFLQAGVDLCFGSDGMPFGPLYGIQAAMDHPFDEERITAAEAVWLYTARAAWACHWDDQVGTLEKGKRADVLILDQANLDAAPATNWIIQETILDGQTMCQGTEPVPHADMMDA